MNALDELNDYLRRVERRIRRLAWCRGATVVAVSSLVATVVLVWLINRFAFSDGSALAARVALFFAVALAAGFGLIVPVLMITRARAARTAEKRFPEFEQRLLTVAERSAREPENPFLELLAADAQPVAEAAEPASVVTGRRMAAFASLAAAALGVLLWLIVAGPGYLGYGAALLWAGPSRVQVQPFYEIRVTPGNRTVRRGAGQIVTAQLVGFQAQRVRLLAKYRNTAKWEEALMQPQAAGSAYEFLFAGLPETVDYYVEAGVLRTDTFTLQVIDLPAVKRIRVTYRFPSWTGLPETVEDPGGDLRAVEGTQAEIAVETDRPLANGLMVLDDGTQIPLQGGVGNLTSARLTMLKDGLYHLAAKEHDETVRLTEDYFIEVQKESAPAVRLTRPGRDARVSPIEEVTLAASAEDDFGLQELTLHYAVNGGPEEKIFVPVARGQRQAEGSSVLYLEDFKLVPGDLVSVYATARDARTSARTDMFFLEAQPFEREYSQSQQMGGGGGGEAGASQNRISQRQKEIIAATWNQLRGKAERAAAAENAKFLADMQSKLRDQARSLATRVVRRELAGTNQEFQSFSDNMTRAAEAMGAAAEKLKAGAWRDALPPEQKALQHLLRAESLFRQIQIAFGRGGGGGGGGGGMGRDLENLFDLELDTEKNQYEAGQRAQSADQRNREIDEALQKLEQLARRQQELAQQQARNRQAFQQRWQQEMLRREAEELQRNMERLTRGGSAASGQTGQTASSASAAERAAAQRQRLQAMTGQAPGDARLRQALERLEQATRDMRSAGRAQAGEAEARRAAERLQEARDVLRGMRRQEAGERLSDMSERAGRLASSQQEFVQRLRQIPADPKPPAAPSAERRQQAEQLAQEKLRQLEELQRLERDMQDAARDLAGSQRGAAARLREALGEMQQEELALRMRYAAEILRRGLGQYLAPREGVVSAGLEQLRDRLREAQGALEGGGGGGSEMERGLAGLERLRRGIQNLGGGPRTTDFSAMNRGDWRPPDPGGMVPRAGDPSEAGRLYGEGLRDLSRLRQAVQDRPELAGDIQQLIREMERLDPRRFPGNPQLVEQLRTQVLPQLEQLELQLRRRVEERSGEQVRTGASEQVPPGYGDAVAEYFRRLSKAR